MNTHTITELLQRTMGLEAASIGTSGVDRAIAARMAKAGIDAPEDYLARLHADRAELDELIEEVVVPESWFFRDGTPFATLKRWVLEQWQPAHPFETLRVLTIPCSTGEEPYSLAMALLDAGLTPGRFSVHAVDISRRALGRAQEGVYRAYSFRGRDLEFRDRYFEELPDGGYSIRPNVRQAVRFEHGNLLSPAFLLQSGVRYDVIFCRNVLIYFDRPTQARAVRTLGGLLTRDGLLFVGHAETGALSGTGLVPTDHAMSFSFRKAQTSTVAPPWPTPRVWKTTRIVPTPSKPPARPSILPPVPPPPATRPVPIIRTPRLDAKPAPPPAAAPGRVTFRPPGNGNGNGSNGNGNPPPLEEARRLADAGSLPEAARLCETHLRERGSSAAAWYLLGVVRDAAGDRAQAAECYAKTLYLDPSHQEALLQRALIAEGAGDTAAAARLRGRIQRAQERNGDA